MSDLPKKVKMFHSETQDHFSFVPVKQTDQIKSIQVFIVESTDEQHYPINLKDPVTLYIIRTKDHERIFKFPFSVIFSCNIMKKLHFLDLRDSEIEVRKKKKNLRLVYDHREDLQLVLKFVYNQDLNTVLRYIGLMKKQAERKKDVIVSLDPEIIVPIRQNIINNYSTQALTKEKKNGGLLGSVSNLSRSAGSGGVVLDQEKEYFSDLVTKRPDSWKIEEMKKWISQIPVFHEGKMRSLYKYMASQNLTLPLEVWSKRPSPMRVLRREVNKEVLELNGSDENLNKILTNPVVVERLKRHFKILYEFMKKHYNPCFYVILRKNLVKNKRTKKYPSIDTVERRLIIHDFWHLWSGRRLQTLIAFSILYGISVKDYITKISRDYTTFKNKEENQELKYLERLKLYNEKIGFPLEHLLFSVFVKKGIEELTLKRLDLHNIVAESKENREKRCLEEVKLIHKEKFNKIELQKSELKEDDEEGKDRISRKEKGLESLIQRDLKKKVEEENNKAKIAEEKIPISRQELVKFRKRESKENLRWKFFALDGVYFQNLKNLINFKLNEIFSSTNNKTDKKDVEESEGEEEEEEKKKEKKDEQHEEVEGEEEEEEEEEKKKKEETEVEEEKKKQIGVVTISAKFVCSRNMASNAQVSEAEKMGMQIYRRFFEFFDKDPECFRMGLTHMGVLFSNISLQWFENSSVVCENVENLDRVMTNYEDLACIDCESIELYSIAQFHEFTEKLVRFVLDSNCNFTYSGFGTRQFWSEDEENCQEFGLRLLKHFGLPDKFYPLVNEFIRFLENDLSLTVEREVHGITVSEECYRSVKVPKGFPDHLLEGESLSVTKRIFFNSHEVLDRFARKTHLFCLGKDGSGLPFELRFPGLYVMVKAFDRAFWTMKFRKRFCLGKNDPWMDEESNSCLCLFHRNNTTEEEEKKMKKEGKKKEEKEEEHEEEEIDGFKIYSKEFLPFKKDLKELLSEEGKKKLEEDIEVFMKEKKAKRKKDDDDEETEGEEEQKQSKEEKEEEAVREIIFGSNTV